VVTKVAPQITGATTVATKAVAVVVAAVTKAIAVAGATKAVAVAAIKENRKAGTKVAPQTTGGINAGMKENGATKVDISGMTPDRILVPIAPPHDPSIGLLQLVATIAMAPSIEKVVQIGTLMLAIGSFGLIEIAEISVTATTNLKAALENQIGEAIEALIAIGLVAIGNEEAGMKAKAELLPMKNGLNAMKPAV